MAQLSFAIADGILTVSGGGRTEQFASTDYKARAQRNGDKDGFIVYPTDGSGESRYKVMWSLEDYTDASFVIDGITLTPTSVNDAVTRFNQACGVSIGYNTQYPQHIVSDHMVLDTSVATQLTPYGKAGYLTISAASGNAANVYVGDENVDNDSYQLEAGTSVFMELDDLSKIWVFGAAADLEVSIVGAYKY